jgi:hypothetical protein
MNRLRPALTYANVVSSIALFVVLGSGAYALGRNTIGAAQLRPKSVGASELQDDSVDRAAIRRDSVGSLQVANKSLVGADFKPGELPEGPPGKTGPAGTNGKPGPAGSPGVNGTGAEMPAGAVLFFNLAACPNGWSELTAARGRYVVGVPAGGTLAATVGTALGNQENRPVGRHDHLAITSPHAHSILVAEGVGNANPDNSVDRLMLTDSPNGQRALFSGNWTDSVGVTDQFASGQSMVAGTNAPYIQLRACVKS